MEDIDQKYYCSDYHNVSVNKCIVKSGTSLRFWENNGWINVMDNYIWFQWYFGYWLGRRFLDDERQINRWKGIASTFEDKVVRIIEDVNGKFDD